VKYKLSEQIASTGARPMKSAAFATMLLVLCCAGQAHAADIYYDPPGGCTLTIEGQIEAGDDVAFYDKIIEGWDLPPLGPGCTLFVVVLASSGGDVGAAIKIGRQIRTVHATTDAPRRFGGQVGYCTTSKGLLEDKNCVCASACFFIWAAGSKRGGDSIYIHRPYFDNKSGGRPLEKTAEAYLSMARIVQTYLREVDIPVAIIDRVFSTSSTEQSLLSPSELDQLWKAPYFDEYVIGKCGAFPERLTGAKRHNEYFDCQEKAHQALVHASFKRYYELYGPFYGAEVAERQLRRRAKSLGVDAHEPQQCSDSQRLTSQCSEQQK
jgi:hypothetical protein